MLRKRSPPLFSNYLGAQTDSAHGHSELNLPEKKAFSPALGSAPGHVLRAERADNVGPEPHHVGADTANMCAPTMKYCQL
jgi:hypothetical protein